MDEPKNPGQAPQQQTDARAAGRRAGPKSRREPRWTTKVLLLAFGALSALLVRALGATWRVEVLGEDPRRDGAGPATADTPAHAHLAALFHESMLPCAWFFRGRGYSVAVSRSRDGDLIRSTLIALGYAEPARGSSSRGGSAALRGLLRKHAEGTTVAVLVDGPRGPARVAKTGIVSLARLADSPIQPVAFSARPAIRLGSWDQSLVPLPFARVVCAFGPPIDAATSGDDLAEQAIARQLDERLVELHHAADRVLLPKKSG